MRKVIVGDRVKMISGSEKGKIGVVKALVKKKRGRSFVVVSGLNIKQYVKRDQSTLQISLLLFFGCISNMCIHFTYFARTKCF